jgi:hypothetical protein
MTKKSSYQEVMAQRAEIVKESLGLDYAQYTVGVLAFDYERLLADTGYDVETACAVQRRTAVGNTPLVELENITELVRAVARPGKGSRIFVKDEAANPSGSFKDRRAALSLHEAKKQGYDGVAVATSGNYGAAVASQAAKAGLRCIVVQEAFDSHGIAQPEIAEKTRACEAYGAEVIRLSVGPELFYVFLCVLQETEYFNKIELLVRGVRCPQVGRITMDMSLINVTALRGKVAIGDEVVIIGRQGVAEITADELAEKLGTINYEVVSTISPRVTRIAVSETMPADG